MVLFSPHWCACGETDRQTDRRGDRQTHGQRSKKLHCLLTESCKLIARHTETQTYSVSKHARTDTHTYCQLGVNLSSTICNATYHSDITCTREPTERPLQSTIVTARPVVSGCWWVVCYTFGTAKRRAWEDRSYTSPITQYSLITCSLHL